MADPAGYVHGIFWGAVFTVGSFFPGKPMNGFVAGPLGVGHVVVAVLQLTAELESFAANVPGFRLYAGAPWAWERPALRGRGSTAATAASTAWPTSV